MSRLGEPPKLPGLSKRHRKQVQAGIDRWRREAAPLKIDSLCGVLDEQLVRLPQTEPQAFLQAAHNEVVELMRTWERQAATDAVFASQFIGEDVMILGEAKGLTGKIGGLLGDVFLAETEKLRSRALDAINDEARRRGHTCQ